LNLQLSGIKVETVPEEYR